MFVFWIDKNKLITGLLEEFAKKANKKLYTLNSLNDAPFLIHDLKPDVVVIDAATFKESSSELQAPILQALTDLSVVITGEEFNSFLKLNLKVIGHLPKPLDIALALETVQSMVELKQ